MKRPDQSDIVQRQRSCYQFTIKINTIKLNVKFPCNMVLKFDSQPISPQVTKLPSNIFNFQHQIILKDSFGAGRFQIGVFLLTQKRQNSMIVNNNMDRSQASTNTIFAGQIKLEQEKMMTYEGRSFDIGLTNCLDNSATCNLTVSRIKNLKHNKNGRNSLQKINDNQQSRISRIHTTSILKHLGPKQASQISNEISSSIQKIRLRIDSRSKAQLPTPSGSNFRQSTIQYRPQRSRQNGRRVDSSTSLKPPLSPTAGYYLDKYSSQQTGASYQNEVNRARSRQGILQRPPYEPINSQLKIDNPRSSSNQRKIQLALQRSQQKRQIEVHRLKSKIEELQKTLQMKDRQVKQQKDKIVILQEQNQSNKYYEEEINSKNTQIQFQQNIIKTLRQQNQQLKLQIIQLQRQQQLLKQSFMSQNDKLINELQNIKQQHYNQMKKKQSFINQLQFQLEVKNTQSSRMKRMIEELQQRLDEKTFQTERDIRMLKQENKRKIDHLNSIIKGLEQSLKSQTLKKIQFQTEIQRLKQLLISKEKQFYASFHQITFNKSRLNYDSNLRGIQNNQSSISQEGLIENFNLKDNNLDWLPRNVELEQKYFQLMKQNKLLKIDILSLNTTIQSLKKQNSNLNKQLVAFKEQINLSPHNLNSFTNLNVDDISLKRQLISLKEQNEYLQQKLQSVNNKFSIYQNQSIPSRSRLKASKLLLLDDKKPKGSKISIRSAQNSLQQIQEYKNQQSWKQLIKDKNKQINMLEKQVQLLKKNQSGKELLHRKTIQLKDYMIHQLQEKLKQKDNQILFLKKKITHESQHYPFQNENENFMVNQAFSQQPADKTNQQVPKPKIQTQFEKLSNILDSIEMNSNINVSEVQFFRNQMNEKDKQIQKLKQLISKMNKNLKYEKNISSIDQKDKKLQKQKMLKIMNDEQTNKETDIQGLRIKIQKKQHIYKDHLNQLEYIVENLKKQQKEQIKQNQEILEKKEQQIIKLRQQVKSLKVQNTRLLNEIINFDISEDKINSRSTTQEGHHHNYHKMNDFWKISYQNLQQQKKQVQNQLEQLQSQIQKQREKYRKIKQQNNQNKQKIEIVSIENLNLKREIGELKLEIQILQKFNKNKNKQQPQYQYKVTTFDGDKNDINIQQISQQESLQQQKNRNQKYKRFDQQEQEEKNIDQDSRKRLKESKNKNNYSVSLSSQPCQQNDFIIQSYRLQNEQLQNENKQLLNRLKQQQREFLIRIEQVEYQLKKRNSYPQSLSKIEEGSNIQESLDDQELRREKSSVVESQLNYYNNNRQEQSDSGRKNSLVQTVPVINLSVNIQPRQKGNKFQISIEENSQIKYNQPNNFKQSIQKIVNLTSQNQDKIQRKQFEKLLKQLQEQKAFNESYKKTIENYKKQIQQIKLYLKQLIEQQIEPQNIKNNINIKQKLVQFIQQRFFSEKQESNKNQQQQILDQQSKKLENNNIGSDQSSSIDPKIKVNTSKMRNSSQWRSLPLPQNIKQNDLKNLKLQSDPLMVGMSQSQLQQNLYMQEQIKQLCQVIQKLQNELQIKNQVISKYEKQLQSMQQKLIEKDQTIKNLINKNQSLNKNKYYKGENFNEQEYQRDQFNEQYDSYNSKISREAEDLSQKQKHKKQQQSHNYVQQQRQEHKQYLNEKNYKNQGYVKQKIKNQFIDVKLKNIQLPQSQVDQVQDSYITKNIDSSKLPFKQKETQKLDQKQNNRMVGQNSKRQSYNQQKKIYIPTVQKEINENDKNIENNLNNKQKDVVINSQKNDFCHSNKSISTIKSNQNEMKQDNNFLIEQIRNKKNRQQHVSGENKIYKDQKLIKSEEVKFFQQNRTSSFPQQVEQSKVQINRLKQTINKLYEQKNQLRMDVQQKQKQICCLTQLCQYVPENILHQQFNRSNKSEQQSYKLSRQTENYLNKLKQTIKAQNNMNKQYDNISPQNKVSDHYKNQIQQQPYHYQQIYQLNNQNINHYSNKEQSSLDKSNQIIMNKYQSPTNIQIIPQNKQPYKVKKSLKQSQQIQYFEKSIQQQEDRKIQQQSNKQYNSYQQTQNLSQQRQKSQQKNKEIQRSYPIQLKQRSYPIQLKQLKTEQQQDKQILSKQELVVKMERKRLLKRQIARQSNQKDYAEEQKNGKNISIGPKQTPHQSVQHQAQINQQEMFNKSEMRTNQINSNQKQKLYKYDKNEQLFKILRSNEQLKQQVKLLTKLLDEKNKQQKQNKSQNQSKIIHSYQDNNNKENNDNKIFIEQINYNNEYNDNKISIKQIKHEKTTQPTTTKISNQKQNYLIDQFNKPKIVNNNQQQLQLSKQNFNGIQENNKLLQQKYPQQHPKDICQKQNYQKLQQQQNQQQSLPIKYIQQQSLTIKDIQQQSLTIKDIQQQNLPIRQNRKQQSLPIRQNRKQQQSFVYSKINIDDNNVYKDQTGQKPLSQNQHQYQSQQQINENNDYDNYGKQLQDKQLEQLQQQTDKTQQFNDQTKQFNNPKQNINITNNTKQNINKLNNPQQNIKIKIINNNNNNQQPQINITHHITNSKQLSKNILPLQQITILTLNNNQQLIKQNNQKITQLQLKIQSIYQQLHKLQYQNHQLNKIILNLTKQQNNIQNLQKKEKYKQKKVKYNHSNNKIENNNKQIIYNKGQKNKKLNNYMKVSNPIYTISQKDLYLQNQLYEQHYSKQLPKKHKQIDQQKDQHTDQHIDQQQQHRFNKQQFQSQNSLINIIPPFKQEQQEDIEPQSQIFNIQKYNLNLLQHHQQTNKQLCSQNNQKQQQQTLKNKNINKSQQKSKQLKQKLQNQKQKQQNKSQQYNQQSLDQIQKLKNKIKILQQKLSSQTQLKINLNTKQNIYSNVNQQQYPFKYQKLNQYKQSKQIQISPQKDSINRFDDKLYIKKIQQLQKQNLSYLSQLTSLKEQFQKIKNIITIVMKSQSVNQNNNKINSKLTVFNTKDNQNYQQSPINKKINKFIQNTPTKNYQYQQETYNIKSVLQNKDQSFKDFSLKELSNRKIQFKPIDSLIFSQTQINKQQQQQQQNNYNPISEIIKILNGVIKSNENKNIIQCKVKEQNYDKVKQQNVNNSNKNDNLPIRNKQVQEQKIQQSKIKQIHNKYQQEINELKEIINNLKRQNQQLLNKNQSFQSLIKNKYFTLQEKEYESIEQNEQIKDQLYLVKLKQNSNVKDSQIQNPNQTISNKGYGHEYNQDKVQQQVVDKGQIGLIQSRNKQLQKNQIQRQGEVKETLKYSNSNSDVRKVQINNNEFSENKIVQQVQMTFEYQDDNRQFKNKQWFQNDMNKFKSNSEQQNKNNSNENTYKIVNQNNRNHLDQGFVVSKQSNIPRLDERFNTQYESYDDKNENKKINQYSLEQQRHNGETQNQQNKDGNSKPVQKSIQKQNSDKIRRQLENNQKIKMLLLDDMKTKQQLKQMILQLIKQKEIINKRQIQQSLKVIELQKLLIDQRDRINSIKKEYIYRQQVMQSLSKQLHDFNLTIDTNQSLQIMMMQLQTKTINSREQQLHANQYQRIEGKKVEKNTTSIHHQIKQNSQIISKLNNKINQLTQINKQLQSNFIKTQQQLTQNKQQLNVLKQHLNNYKQQNYNYKDKITQYQQQINQYQQQIQQYQQQIKTLIQKLKYYTEKQKQKQQKQKQKQSNQNIINNTSNPLKNSKNQPSIYNKSIPSNQSLKTTDKQQVSSPKNNIQPKINVQSPKSPIYQTKSNFTKNINQLKNNQLKNYKQNIQSQTQTQIKKSINQSKSIANINQSKSISNIITQQHKQQTKKQKLTSPRVIGSIGTIKKVDTNFNNRLKKSSTNIPNISQ